MSWIARAWKFQRSVSEEIHLRNTVCDPQQSRRRMSRKASSDARLCRESQNGKGLTDRLRKQRQVVSCWSEPQKHSGSESSLRCRLKNRVAKAALIDRQSGSGLPGWTAICGGGRGNMSSGSPLAGSLDFGRSCTMRGQFRLAGIVRDAGKEKVQHCITIMIPACRKNRLRCS